MRLFGTRFLLVMHHKRLVARLIQLSQFPCLHLPTTHTWMRKGPVGAFKYKRTWVRMDQTKAEMFPRYFTIPPSTASRDLQHKFDSSKNETNQIPSMFLSKTCHWYEVESFWKTRLHMRFLMRFLMRFRVKKNPALPYPARMLFFAKHRMEHVAVFCRSVTRLKTRAG